MMTMEIYANYGCLSAEKRMLYTCDSPDGTAVTYDKINVQIPDGWELSENYSGALLLIDTDGETHLVNQILCGNKDPYLDGYSKGDEFIIKLVKFD